MKRQITLSPATLALGAGLAVAVLVVAVLATVMLTGGGGDTSAPAQASPFTATPTTPPTAVPSASVSPTPSATETPAPTATPLPPTPAAVPTPVVVIVQATAVPPLPTPVPPAATATPQLAVSPSGDYLRVVSKNFSGGPAASLTLEYRAFPRAGGEFYISAFIYGAGGGSCDFTAIRGIPTSGTVTINFPWARMGPACSPDLFSSLYACVSMDGKDAVCVNVYK